MERAAVPNMIRGQRHGYILFHMNGTGRVEFDKGYYYNGDLGYYLSEDVDCWFRITNAFI